MKTSRYILCLVYLLAISQFSFSQIAVPKFKEANPLWHYLFIDKNFVSDGGVINQFNSISVITQDIHDQSLYLTNSCLNSRSDIYGGMLAKLDLQTGDLIWEQYFNRFSGEPLQEYYYRPVLSDENQLILIGKQKIAKPNNYYPLWAELPTRPVKRIYDTNTGQLLKHIYKASDTVGIISGPGGGAFLTSDSRDVHIYCAPEYRTFYFHQLDSSDYYYKFYRLGDSLSLPISHFDSILYIPTGKVDDFSFNDFSPISRLNDSIILGWVWHHNLDDDVFRSQLIWMKVKDDYTLEMVRRKDIEQYIMYHNFFATRYIMQDGDDLIISDTYLRNNASETRRWMLWLDPDGNVKAHTYDLAYKDNPYYIVRPLKHTDTHLYLVGSPSHLDSKGVDILSLDKSGHVSFLGSVTPTDDIEFPIGANDQKMTDDKLILIGALNKTIRYAVAFNLKDLGIDLSSNTVSEVGNNDYEIYPNPSSNVLSITHSTFLTSELNLTVYDRQGQPVMTKQFNFQKEIELNITTIPSGIYLVQILDSNGKNVYPIKKVVKS